MGAEGLRAGVGCARVERMTDASGPPFRADHVGSLLRPPNLLDARAKQPPGRSTTTNCAGSRTRRSATSCGCRPTSG
jgi:hypothetical protein